MYLYFWACLHLFLLWDGVGHHHGFKGSVINAGDGRAGEDSMSENGVDLDRSGVNEPK